MYRRNVDLAFANKTLRLACENPAKAIQLFGGKVAEKLRARLADIDAAMEAREIVAGMPREIAAGVLAIDLADGYVMQLSVVAARSTSASSMDWRSASRLKLTGIYRQ